MPTVCLIDDDPELRESLRLLLEGLSFDVRSYGSGVAFLQDDFSDCGCIISDIRMPAMDGLELQAALVERPAPPPVIFITGHGDIPMAVKAMKAGALDFLEKPVDPDVLTDSVRRALVLKTCSEERRREADDARRALAQLTTRERDVLEQLVEGKPNKVIAIHLNISPRTVEIHRANLLRKLACRSLADLVRTRFAAGDTLH